MCKSLLDHYYQDNFIQCNNLRQESMMVAEYKRVHAIADEDIQEN